MRFSTVASAALAPALAAAYNANADLKNNLGTARIYNKCSKPVYIWSVLKEQGCDKGEMIKLEPNAAPYEEKYRDDKSETGVSIKISWTEQCKGDGIDITQLEYYINHAPGFDVNFLDVSFVDCLGGNCPGRGDFLLKSGNNGDPRLATAGADKAICPILKCTTKEECATMAYILPDDVQTKSCEPAADMDFYLCGGKGDGEYEEPEDDESDDEEEEEKEPTPSSQPEEKPYPTLDVPSLVEDVSASEVTPAPQEEVPEAPKVKTEVVYVTQYEYVNAKRHAHGHRHKHFRA
jgi:hypothetical protein